MRKESLLKHTNNFLLFFFLVLLSVRTNAQIIATFSTTTALPIDLDAGTNYASCVSPGTKAFTFSVSGVSTLNTGANQLAIGNHTHTAGAVGAHTHGASLLMNSMAISGGAHGHTGQNGSHTHGVTPTGSVSVGAVITSTLKLKKDISDFTVADPKNILNLKMKKYKYKNSVRGIQNRYNREWMYGYIAEEVQDLGVEQILAYDKNGDPDGIDYGLLSVLVLELVKVQQTEIDSLKEEIQRLKEVI
jgi:X-X-X-Leu-X-X-Gly heptad repeat protein